MSKKKNNKTEFVKWLGPILDALRELGGSAKPKEITKFIGEKHNLPARTHPAPPRKKRTARYDL